MRLSLPLLLSLSAPAFGTVIIGNPTTSVVLVDGPKTYVHSVLGTRCSGPVQTLEVGEVLLKDDSTPITFAEDEFCAIDVRVIWVPGGPLVTVPVDGFDTFKALANSTTVQIDLDATTQSAELH